MPGPGGRRPRRRAAVVTLAGLAGVALLGVAVAVGQPRLSWRLRPADNRLQLGLAVGSGPLAGWLLDHAGLELAGRRRGQHAVQQLRPGERVRERVELAGLPPRTELVTLRVPPAPQLRLSRLAARTLELRFDVRVGAVLAAPGRAAPGVVAATGTAVRLARTARPQRLRLRVTARDGEQTQLVVRIPPLAAVAWTAGPARLGRRTPLLVRFAQPIRWGRGRAGLPLAPAVAGRWETVGTSTLRFVPRSGWPRGGRLRVVVPAAAPLAGRDGALVASGAVALLLPSPRRSPGRRARRPRGGRPGSPPGPTIPVYSFGNPARGRLYITIDDGWFPSVGVLRLMRRFHLPITTFLIADAVREDIPFWRAFVAAGGVIEDHTVSHPDLNTLTPRGALLQWAANRVRLQRWLGRSPTLGRPPYGDADPSVLRAARLAGLRGIVLWSATDTNGRIQTWNGEPLEAGEIILLHWDPGLTGELQRLVSLIRARHLTPAPLVPGLF
ncbi:MAG TPA: polysaccharide deacetylase family protein [Verrucomicrobiae bacterium]|nr:polysaccharide deacetylase family protein [Verrucomicrobiae bacterium]